MKLLQRLIYCSLIFAAVFYLQSLDFSFDAHLDVKSWTDDLCKDFGAAGGRTELATDSERQTAKDLVNSMSSADMKKIVTDMLNKQEAPPTDELMKLLPFIVPWAVFLLMSLIGWMFYCCYCICDEKCPPSQCCRRDFKKNPYTNAEILVPVGLALVLNLLILSAAIAGLVVAGDVARGIKATRCSFMGLFYDILYQQSGTTSKNVYPGLTGIKTQLDKLTTSIDDFQLHLKTTFGEKRSVEINTKYQSLVSLDNNAKRGASSSTLPVGTPETYLSANRVFDYILASTSDSDFSNIANTFRALSSSYRDNLPATPQLSLFNEYFEGLITTSKELETSGMNVATQSDMSSSLSSGKSTTSTLITSVEDAGKVLYDFTKPMEDYSSYITTALQGLFGALLGFSLIAIVSTIFLQFFKYYSLRGLMHLVWGFYVLLMILGFFIALVLHPTSAITAEFCVYLDSYVSDKVFFDSATLVKDKSTKDTLATCFYNGGNIFSQLSLDKVINDLNSLTNQIDQFNTQFNSSQSSKTQVESSVASNVKCIQNIVDAVVIDLEPNLASAANQAGQQPIQSGHWTPSLNQQKSIQTQFLTTSDVFWGYMDEISKLIQESNDIINTISGPNGLVGGMNCGFLKNTFKRVIDGMCVIFIPAVQKTTILIIICSIGMFFGSLANCCVGLRFYRKKKYGDSDSKVHSAKQERGDETEMQQIKN